jgi:hypothetical protein
MNLWTYELKFSSLEITVVSGKNEDDYSRSMNLEDFPNIQKSNATSHSIYLESGYNCTINLVTCGIKKLIMRTTDIIKELCRLPVNKRIYVIEKTIQSIRQQEDYHQMTIATDSLGNDYKNDKELTVFTNIDFEDFYETR